MVAAVACGKKGPPQPPLARVPAPPANVQAVRVGDEVYVSFDVPSANTSGQTPADMDSVEVLAFTGTAGPPGADPTVHAARVGTWAVLPSLPVAPDAPEGAPPPPAPRAFIQGTRAVVREALTPDVLAPTPLQAVVSATVEPDLPPAPGPLIGPAGSGGLKRFYYVVARGPRGRESTPSTAVAVSLQPPTRPPTALTIDYTASDITLAWTAPPDARMPPPPPDPALLPSRPLVEAPPATTYHVFEVPPSVPEPDAYRAVVPAPLTPAPLAETQTTVPGPLAFGVERCFAVRAVDTLDGIVTVGPASEPACLTPADRFPPDPPQRLAAIAGVGVINLIWEPNTEADLAGYVVLRGIAPGDTLQALTPSPIRDTTYRDETVRPGERYVYAVVAVDNATPQNVSGQSNRVEESPRAPR